MNKKQLVVRSLAHYWRTNLAIVAGVVAGTAVIGGALVVGDSVRGSLRQMSLDRLGHIDHSVSGHRYFREELADQMARQPKFSRQFQSIAPALVLQGSLEHTQQSEVARVAGVSIFGVDHRAWSMTSHGKVAVPEEDSIILSQGTAAQLGVHAGDRVTLWVELPSRIPRDSLLGEREFVSREIALQVQSVLEATSGVGRLALNPNQQQPKNAFVSLSLLQDRLNLSRRSASRRNPVSRPAQVNSLFVQARKDRDAVGDGAVAASTTLTELLSQSWTLADLGLRITTNSEQGVLSLESQRMVLEEVFASAAQRAATKQHRQSSPVLVSLSNQIANTQRLQQGKPPETNYSMYSLVAGVDFTADPPFGPVPGLKAQPTALGPNEAMINSWLAADLDVAAGDRISIRYHQVGSHGELPEKHLEFIVRSVVPLEGVVADRGMTPQVDGITNIRSMRDWDQPFPMEIARITERDEQYWDAYGPTPKVFISRQRAQELWRSRYGALTSFRVADAAASGSDIFGGEVLRQLSPTELGLAFQPIKYQGLQAAVGANDFTQLFLAFSFFLIFSATTLIALLFRLNVERRSRGVGLLAAVGFTPRQVRQQFLSEALLVVLAGGLLGVVAAVGYAELMVYGLKTWWVAAMGTQYIHVYVRASSLISGMIVSMGTALLVVWWALRQLNSASVRGLLSGEIKAEVQSAQATRRRTRLRKMSITLAVVAAVLLVAAVAGLVPGREAFSGFSWRVVCFFVIGTSLLSSNLMSLSLWLQSDRKAVDGR
ncbi:MAG: FtsX-like permease family protein, partial [Planctomycetaceae bacterium]